MDDNTNQRDAVNFNLKLRTFDKLKLRTVPEVDPKLGRDLRLMFTPGCELDAGSGATGAQLAARRGAEGITRRLADAHRRPSVGRAEDPGAPASESCCPGC